MTGLRKLGGVYDSGRFVKMGVVAVVFVSDSYL
jgi:hypothetical protein